MNDSRTIWLPNGRTIDMATVATVRNTINDWVELKHHDGSTVTYAGEDADAIREHVGRRLGPMFPDLPRKRPMVGAFKMSRDTFDRLARSIEPGMLPPGEARLLGHMIPLVIDETVPAGIVQPITSAEYNAHLLDQSEVS